MAHDTVSTTGSIRSNPTGQLEHPGKKKVIMNRPAETVNSLKRADQFSAKSPKASVKNSVEGVVRNG